MDNLDINTQILHELQTINRRNRSALIVLIVVLVVFAASSSVLFWTTSSRRHAYKKAETTWNDVRNLRERGQFSEALSSAERIAQKTPNDWYAHSMLAYIHLEMGNLNDAEKEFAVGYKMWPTEDNEKDLTAIRKRIESEKMKK